MTPMTETNDAREACCEACDPGTLALADADWQPPTGNPWSAHYRPQA